MINGNVLWVRFSKVLHKLPCFSILNQLTVKSKGGSGVGELTVKRTGK
jgi:hypothetical protein